MFCDGDFSALLRALLRQRRRFITIPGVTGLFADWIIHGLQFSRPCTFRCRCHWCPPI